MKACVNGRVVEEKKAVVSVLDYGLLYGYGIYETMRAENSVVFRLDRHLARMRNGSRELNLQVPWSDAEIKKMIEKTLSVNKLRDAYVRLTLTRGAGEPRLDMKATAPTLVIIVRLLPSDIEEKRRKGVRVKVSKKYFRFSKDVRSRVKSTNYLVNAIAKQEAAESGVDDMVLMNERGFVAECSTANIFLVVGGKIITPPADAGALSGITREAVIGIAKTLRLKVEEKAVSRKKLLGADEVFKTSAIMGVVPVTEVDGGKIGDGKIGGITRMIQAAYRELSEKECGTF
jgi:branched-chain amino acid aminotransferase